ncbi:PucR family transcriptional regulator [Actinomadura craniellae]|uniref:PucR family transcriptional regulator n=1 Tax=Actinomadura craniellae TaxID=2231787 RepID=A0A365GZE3_9ACTN|nr:PucR family transcriptional regulator [Actinomadura craniellae]
MITEIRSRVREYDRPEDDPCSATLRYVVESVLQHFTDRISYVEADPRPVMEFFRAIGRSEAAEGRDLETIHTALRVGGLVAWRHVVTGADRFGALPRTLGTLGEDLLLFQHELAEAAAEGHAQARADVVGAMQRRRRHLIDMLLTDPPVSPEPIAEHAAAAHWPMPRTVAVAALSRLHRDEPQPVFPADVLVDLTRHEPALIVPDPDGPGRSRMVDRALHGRTVALGPTVPVAEAARSMRWARKTLALVERKIIEPCGVARSVEHMSTLILFEDEDLLAGLGALRLAPLEHLRPSQQDRLAETLLAWLQSSRNANEVASRLHVHPQTVRYRLRQLDELFGDQLLDPELCFDLEIVLRVRRMLSGDRFALAADPAVTR